MHSLLLWSWAFCVCLGFFGYGYALLALCRVRDGGWALACSLGVALITAAGGVLELAGMVRVPVLIGLVTIGDVLLVTNLWRRRASVAEEFAGSFRWLRGDRIAAVLLLLVVVCAAVRLNGNLETRYFHVNDDMGGYLSFPAEMLQLGSLPSDPFSERRVTSGFGGSYFQQTFLMVAGDARTVRFLDWGFGFVLYAGIVFAISRRLGVGRRAALLLALLVFVIPLRRTNSTMVVLPAALFATLFLLELLEDGDTGEWVRAVFFGLTAGALCALKATNLPAAGLVGGLYYAVRLLLVRRTAIVGQAAVCVVAAGGSLFPWMLDLKAKEGTYLFPVLGRGFDASAYGTVPVPGHGAWADSSLWAALVALAAPFLLATVSVFLARRQKAEPQPLLPAGFFLAIAGSAIVVAVATGGEAMARYTLPFIAPGILVFAAYIFRWGQRLHPRPMWVLVAAVFCIGWTGAIVVRYGMQNYVYREYLTDAGYPPASQDVITLDFQAERSRVAALQKHVPPGAPLLEHLLVAYPLDFKRNPVYVADFPGLAGLPPGMPVGKGAIMLRNYLLAEGIHYVAFTYGRGRMVDLDPALTLSDLIAHPSLGGRHTWLLIQNKVAVDVQHNLDELRGETRRVYDDGEECLLDLGKPPDSHSGLS